MGGKGREEGDLSSTESAAHKNPWITTDREGERYVRQKGEDGRAQVLVVSVFA